MTNYYTTSDPYYAAYLSVANVPFRGVTKDPTGKVQFNFEPATNIHDLKQGFYGGSARVPAYAYAKEVRSMKGLLR